MILGCSILLPIVDCSNDGLPVGLMLTGRHYEEATLYKAAFAFEQHKDWKNL